MLIQSKEAEIRAWVSDSQARFNDALKEVSDANQRHPGRELPWGWESVGANKVFMASFFCAEATKAYGIAMLERFPFLRGLQTIFLRPKALGIEHHVLGAPIEDKFFLLDGSFGQIERQENTVKFDTWEAMLDLYAPAAFLPRVDTTFLQRHAGSNPRIDLGRVGRADFNPSVIGSTEELVFDGRSMLPATYLAQRLLER